MMKRLAIAAAATWSLTVPAAFAQAPATTTTTTQRATRAVSDASITTAVKTRLSADKTVGGLAIDVDTSDGAVTLSGAVKSAAERARAMRLARNTTGVTRVIDKMTIEPTAGTSGHTATDTSKDTTVVIKDDVTPKVKKGAEKTADVAKDVAGKTADIAKDVAGKTSNAAKKTADDVKNTKVEVKDDAGVGDASVTTAVKTRLMTDEVARGTSIDVHTNDGVVTISGNVPTAADRTRIGELVQKTTGVKRVVNNLTVK